MHNIPSTNPLLSIITTMYNSAAFLAVCIESVLKQNYPKIEFIIVDDGSTDDSYVIAEKYATQDPRIKLIKLEENMGQPTAMNKALDICTGDLITFIDSDDEIEPCTYQDAITLMQKDANIDLVQFPVTWGYATKREEWIDGLGDILEEKEQILTHWVYKDFRMTWIKCDKVFRAKLFENVRFYPKIYFEDNLALVSIFMNVNKMAFTHTGSYRYYLHTEQKLTWTEKRSLDSMFVQCESIAILKKEYPMFRTVRAEFYSRIANACVIDYRSKGSNSEVVVKAKATLKQMPMADIWGKNRLSLKAKLKLSALKLWAVWL